MKNQSKSYILTKIIVIYAGLLALGILFMGPFVFGLFSSFKDNANDWPPKFSSAQLTPSNWFGCYRLAEQGCGSGLFGELKPHREITLEVAFNYPDDIKFESPDIRITDRGIDAAKITSPVGKVEIKKIEKKIIAAEDKKSKDIFYKITLFNNSDAVISVLPVDIEVNSRKIKYIESTRAPNRIERRGKLMSWDNLVSGVVPYIFYQYNRVFSEQYSPTTGKPLFLLWIRNSFLYAFVKVFVTIVFTSMAGFALSRLKFRGKSLIFVIMLFSMMVPSQVTFISNYLVLRDGIFGITSLFGMSTLLNTYSGLVISGLVAASSVFIMKQFFDSLSSEIEEAALIDGANTYQIFYKIMLPLAKPAIGAISILSFQGAWNDFFAPMVYITAPVDKFPLTIGLKSFENTYTGGAVDWGPILAGTIISALPVLILFIFFQKYFMQGISFGGSKE